MRHPAPAAMRRRRKRARRGIGLRFHAQNAITALAVLLGTGVADAAELSVEEVVAKNVRASRFADASADATFLLTEPNGLVRVMSAITRTKLAPNGTDNMRIVWFSSPAEVRGLATLLIGHGDGRDDILLYLPASKKTQQLAPAEERDPFVGTDFAYADLIGFNPHDWQYRLARRQQMNDHEALVVVSIPASPAVQQQSGYAKRMEWIRADNFVTEKAQLYGEGDKLLKIVTAADIRPVDPQKTRWQAMRLDARNMLTGRTTALKFDNYTINVGLTAEQFSRRALELGP